MKASTLFSATRLLPLAVGSLFLTGCFGEGNLEDQLSQAVLSEWASEGVTFMGNMGPQPISAVEVTGDRSRLITYPDPEALGGEVTWEVRVTEVEAYPLFPGGEFSQYLNDMAVRENRRNGIPSSMREAVDQGRILAIGRIQLHASRRGRTAEVPVGRVAVLEARGADEDPVWVFQQEDRNHNILWRATKLTYDFLMTRDERVMDCTADVSGTGPREERRDCAVEVMEREYGQKGP